jgi:short subunit dehydrogenase-like uncharacterized protein
VDLTGEAPFIRETIDAFHTDAEAAGVKIVHSCGFDCIPCDLGSMLAMQYLRQQGAEQCNVKLLVTTANGSASGGTIDSAAGILAWARVLRSHYR